MLLHGQTAGYTTVQMLSEAVSAAAHHSIAAAGWYAPTFLSVIGAGVDGVFTPADPWPFIALHYLQVRSGS